MACPTPLNAACSKDMTPLSTSLNAASRRSVAAGAQGFCLSTILRVPGRDP